MSRSRDGYVSKWISNAVERGVLEVNIRLMTTSKLYLTYELLTSKLVKLTLGTQMSLEKLPPDVPLPALKRLFVDTVVFTFEDLTKCSKDRILFLQRFRSCKQDLRRSSSDETGRRNCGVTQKTCRWWFPCVSDQHWSLHNQIQSSLQMESLRVYVVRWRMRWRNPCSG
ncbi:hypothetical protein Bca52824_077905 [Brassica carinata]|uniref:Uncharacterized protein n=1 Tax=Brassica carinata TaxID=52824 RepID=A0A8X7PUV7_BRACI|nr:hypothetical protein Bca52824_077905 [Brassica carinata]